MPDKNDQRIEIRLSEKDKGKLVALASKHKCTFAEYVRRTIRKETV